MIRTLLNCLALTSLLLFFQGPSYAQTFKKTQQSDLPGGTKPGMSGDVLKCAVTELTDNQRRALETEMARAARIRNAGGKILAGITWVPIRPHILRRNDGNGGYSVNSLNNILALTNSYHIQNGTGIQFFYAGTSFDYIDNTNWYNNFTTTIEGAVANSRDANNALNQYYADYTSEGWGGYANYPTNTLSSTRSFIRTGFPETEEDLANRVVPHELGHNFNLIHTFGNSNGTEPSTELVTRGPGANCSYTGDMLCETPADPFGKEGFSVFKVNGCVSYNGTALDANGEAYAPSVSNMMGYYQACNHHFVPSQYERMQNALALRQSHTAYSLDYPSTDVPAVTSLTAGFNQATATVVLTWQDNASNEMGYFIERSLSSESGFIPIGGVGPNMTRFTDTKAGATTNYFYRIRPSNSTEGISMTAAVTTDCSAPRNMKTINVTTSGAELNWLQSGPEVDYDLRWRVANTGAWTDVNNLATPDYTLSSLTPGVNYEWQVRNKCISGLSVYTESTVFGTAVCPYPLGATNTDIGNSSAQLSWINMGVGTVYELQWKLTSAADWTTVINLTSPNYLLTGLSEGTSYDWQVRRRCEQNTFSEFTGKSFRTLSPICTPTYSYDCSDYGLQSFSLNSVTLSENSGCSPNGYAVFPGTTNVAPGQTVPFIATFLNALNPLGVAIWMDANHNGMFEDNERVFFTPSLLTGSVSGNLMIPFTSAGPLSMRVSVAYDTTPNSSCGKYFIGETEDYVLTVAGEIVTCTPTYNNECSGEDGLKRVVVNGAILSNNSGCSPNGYSAMPGTAYVQAGQTVSISGNRLNDYSPHGITIWLDINRNTVFETGELVFSTPEATPGAFSGNISIPSGLAPGPLTMRIVSAFQTVPTNACGNYNFGETEDYTLTVEDPAQCVVHISDTQTVLNCSRPTINLLASTAFPGATYLWSTGATTASIEVATAGIYTVTMTSGGCNSTQSKTITGSSTTISATISGLDALSCSEKRIVLTANTDSDNPVYSWNTRAITKTINVTTIGTYAVTVTSGGCSAIATKTITGSTALPTVRITSPSTKLSCSLTSIELTATTTAPNPTYLWSTGETTRRIAVTTAGNYSVDMTSQEGCVATASRNITGFTDPLTVNIVGNTLLTCEQPTSSLSPVNNYGDGVIYQWNTGATTPGLSVHTPGTYIVVLTLGTCTATDTIVITSTIETPVVTTTFADLTYCSQQIGPEIALAGTPAGVTFDISGGAEIGITNQRGVDRIFEFNAFNPGTTPITATITITPKTICATGSPVTFTITVNPSPIVSITGATDMCAGASTQLIGTPAAGTWQSRYGELATISEGLVASRRQGEAIITYEVEGTNGCVGSNIHFIQIKPSTLAVAGDAVTSTAGLDPAEVFADDCRIIASVVPSGGSPVSGEMVSKVYIDETVPQFRPYVARHYDLSPTVNPAAATATITLYFTQQDFDNYNIAAGDILLPSSPSDSKLNLYINQFHGTSETGAPNSYTGGAGLPFHPMDDNIVWNTDLDRWEVTFDVSGFSGFFVTGNSNPFPVTLTKITAAVIDNKDVAIEWETSAEVNFDHFELQKSADPKNGFSFLANIAPQAATGKYLYMDKTAKSGTTRYYRLKMIDLDGSYSFSKIVAARLEKSVVEVNVFPNPAGEDLFVTSSEPILGFKLINDSGITVFAKLTENETRNEKLDLTSYQSGIYQLKISLKDGKELVRKILLIR